MSALPRPRCDRACHVLAVLLVAAGAARGLEDTVRVEAVALLAEQTEAALQCGDQPSVWLPLLGQRKGWPVTAVDSKTITVLIEKNPFPLAGHFEFKEGATLKVGKETLEVAKVLTERQKVEERLNGIPDIDYVTTTVGTQGSANPLRGASLAAAATLVLSAGAARARIVSPDFPRRRRRRSRGRSDGRQFAPADVLGNPFHVSEGPAEEHPVALAEMAVAAGARTDRPVRLRASPPAVFQVLAVAAFGGKVGLQGREFLEARAADKVGERRFRKVPD
jgi:hypothetical protein